MAARNPWARTVDVDHPYKVFCSNGWEWRVLKAYQTPERERNNRWARWFCAVKSPYTFGDWEYGDTYVGDIPGAVRGERQCAGTEPE